MDMLVAIVFVLVLGLAVAQFFIMSGAFKRRGKQAGEARSAALGGAEGDKTRPGGGNTSESTGPGRAGEGGGGGGARQ